MRPLQVQQLPVEVDLGLMAIKGCSILIRTQGRVMAIGGYSTLPRTPGNGNEKVLHTLQISKTEACPPDAGHLLFLVEGVLTPLQLTYSQPGQQGVSS